MWVERLIEGDRNARIRLDEAPLAPRQARRARRQARRLAADRGRRPAAPGSCISTTRRPSPREIFTGEASLDGLLLRRPVHRHHLPARRLGARAGLHLHVPLAALPGGACSTRTATSSPTRTGAASRAARSRRRPSWAGRGDCIDCNACVAVCPTGIDIRDGQQLECIGCGLCIDACNDVMAQDRPAARADHARHRAQPGAARRGRSRRCAACVRPRTVIYAAILAAGRRRHAGRPRRRAPRSTSTCCTTATRCS